MFSSRLLWLLGSLTSLFTSTVAINLAGQITQNDILKDLKDFAATKVILDDGRQYSAVTRNGGFSIPNVNPGTYILQVLSPEYAFDQYRVDVLPDVDVPQVQPYLPGTPLNNPNSLSTYTMSYPLVLEARRHLNFFVPKESFNVMGMLKSPMVLMMVFAGGMALGLPYLMKNLDPDTMKEITERHQQMAKVQSSMDVSSGLSKLLSDATSPGKQTDGDDVSKGKTKGKKKR